MKTLTTPSQNHKLTKLKSRLSNIDKICQYLKIDFSTLRFISTKSDNKLHKELFD